MTDMAKKIKNKIQGTEAKAKTEEIMLKGNQAQNTQQSQDKNKRCLIG